MTMQYVRVTSLKVVPMGTLNKAPPTHAIVYRLNIKPKNKKVDVEYSGAYHHDFGPNEDIVSFLKRLAQNPDANMGTGPDEPVPGHGKSNLSIRFDQFAYIVILLEDGNWKYSEERAPFEVEEGNAPYYTNPICAWMYNNGPVVGPTPPANTCRVACFVADAAEDKINSPNPHDFATAFNIYLDLALERKDNPNITRLLSIVVDPDVGHPGGFEAPLP